MRFEKFFSSSSGFNYPGEIQLAKDNLLTTLPSVGPDYYVSLELLVTKHRQGDWLNVIQLTKGCNSGAYGCRVPGIWLNADHKLYINAAINGVNDYKYIHGHPLKENVWTRLEIQQIFKGNKVDYLEILFNV